MNISVLFYKAEHNRKGKLPWLSFFELTFKNTTGNLEYNEELLFWRRVRKCKTNIETIEVGLVRTIP